MSFILPGMMGANVRPISFNTYSVNLDGVNDYIDIDGFTTQISTDTTGSFGFRIKLPDATPTATMTPFYIGNEDADTRLWINCNTDGTCGALLRHSGVNQWYIKTDAAVFVDNTWHSVIVTQDGVEPILYIDGVKPAQSFIASADNTQWVNDLTSINAVRLGHQRLTGSTYNLFAGLLDECFYTATVLSSLNAASIHNSNVPQDLSTYSPKGWWRMGDNDGGTGTTVTDQGSGGNNGTLINGPTFSTDVPVSFTNTYSVSFDAVNDYISIADSPDLSFGDSVNDSPFSISCRVKLNTGFVNTGLAGKINSSVAEYAINIVQATKKPFFKIYDESISIGRGWTFDTVLSEDVWYHLVYTYDGRGGTGAADGMKCYLDGVELTAKTASNDGTYVAMHNQSAPLLIGGFSDFSQFFDGKVDELAIFNTELSAVQADAIYNLGVPASLASYSPVGWWRMGDNDGGTGTTVTDQGSGGNNGTLTNGPTFSTDVS